MRAPDGRPANDLRPVLLGVEDAGRLLGCGRTLVYQLIRSGRLQAIKLGTLTKVPMSSIEAFIDQAVIDARSEREYNEHMYGERRGVGQ
jgi:excisionase family DNA binding protein